MAPIIVHNTHIYIRELPSEIDSLLPQCSAEIIEQLNSISSPRRKREIVASHLLIKEILGDVPLDTYEVSQWLKDFITENTEVLYK